MLAISLDNNCPLYHFDNGTNCICDRLIFWVANSCFADRADKFLIINNDSVVAVKRKPVFDDDGENIHDSPYADLYADNPATFDKMFSVKIHSI